MKSAFKVSSWLITVSTLPVSNSKNFISIPLPLPLPALVRCPSTLTRLSAAQRISCRGDVVPRPYPSYLLNVSDVGDAVPFLVDLANVSLALFEDLPVRASLIGGVDISPRKQNVCPIPGWSSMSFVSQFELRLRMKLYSRSGAQEQMNGWRARCLTSSTAAAWCSSASVLSR